MSNTKKFLFTSVFVINFLVVGCSTEVQPTPQTDDAPPRTDSKIAHTAGHGGPVIPLGDTQIGPFDVLATRDKGQIVAGKDAPIDVTVTPMANSTIQAVAVRFWIGAKDGIGSMKAKADIENPAEPNRWHTHAEIPNPIPTGSKLWVEIETNNGEKMTGSFDLKTE